MINGCDSSVSPPSYQRGAARCPPALHLTALTLVSGLHLLTLCRLAVQAAHRPTPYLRGYRAHTLLCRGSGRPLCFIVAPANHHDGPCARPLLTWALRLYALRPCVIGMDAAYWGPALVQWLHAALGAMAVVPWNPKNTKNRDCLPPTWTLAEPGKRSGIERFFGRVFRFFGLQRPPLCGWTAVVALAAQQADRPDLIRAPKRVLAHLWEGPMG